MTDPKYTPSRASRLRSWAAIMPAEGRIRTLDDADRIPALRTVISMHARMCDRIANLHTTTGAKAWHP